MNVACDVEIDMETLRLATDLSYSRMGERLQAQWKVVHAVIEGLEPESRRRFQAYQKENDPKGGE